MCLSRCPVGSYTTAMTASNEHGDGQFYSTHWSLVAQAAEGSSPQSREALEVLCRTYWYPVYAFIRRKQHQPAAS